MAITTCIPIENTATEKAIVQGVLSRPRHLDGLHALSVRIESHQTRHIAQPSIHLNDPINAAQQAARSAPFAPLQSLWITCRSCDLHWLGIRDSQIEYPKGRAARASGFNHGEQGAIGRQAHLLHIFAHTEYRRSLFET